MKIRRFFAPDMRRAIQQVRTEQGADAVILSSRAVEGGIEIVSAVDYDHELVAQMARPSASTQRSDGAGVSDMPVQPLTAAADAPDPHGDPVAAVHDEPAENAD